jgi:hypothetical protein
LGSTSSYATTAYGEQQKEDANPCHSMWLFRQTMRTTYGLALSYYTFKENQQKMGRNLFFVPKLPDYDTCLSDIDALTWRFKIVFAKAGFLLPKEVQVAIGYYNLHIDDDTSNSLNFDAFPKKAWIYIQYEDRI